MNRPCKLISLHKHPMSFAFAYKKDDCYLINGCWTIKENEERDGCKDYYFFFKCNKDKCKVYPKIIESKTFKITEQMMMNPLINIFDSVLDIKNIYFENDKDKNLVNDKQFFLSTFHKLKSEIKELDDKIYIGTIEERIEYFYRKYIVYKNRTIKLQEENINYKTKNEDLKSKCNQLSQKNSFLESKNESLKTENSSIQKSLESKIIFEKDKNNTEETYDIVISILSMFDLSKKGWIIKYPKGKEEYLRKSEKNTIIIGVVGNGNKGKSFILGKLTGYQVPQGFTIRTEGLSIRYGEKDDHCIAILDSAGQETPLLNMKLTEENDNKKEANEENNIDKDKDIEFEKCLRDKLITETYIQQFIFDTSHILLLVIGAITLNEQKILERVKRQLTKDKYLFVIHNLQNFHSKEQVNDYIENTLKKLFGLGIEERNFQDVPINCHQKFYVEVENGKNNKITHLIFVNDYSPIAYYFNEPTTSFLKKTLEVEQNRTKFSVVEKCKEFLIKIQSEYLEGKIEENDFSKENEKIILKSDKNIELKKILIDEIGKTITNYTDQPNYYYYTEKEKFIICIELPGEGADIKTRLQKISEYYIFEFKCKKPGSTNKNNETPKIQKNLRGDYNFKFEIRIPFKDIDILPNKEGKMNYSEKEYKNGIFTFRYQTLGESGWD